MNNHTDFLAARKSGIGGSDIGAILGVSKFKSALDVYLSKTQPEEDSEPNNAEYLYWGHALENPIIDRFIADTGYTVFRQPEIRRHPQHNWALANADALILDEQRAPQGILEIKTSNAFKTAEWGAEDSDQIPMEYIAQVQWYMWIYGLDYSYLAVLIGGNSYKHYRLERDQGLIDIMQARAADFWHQHVLPRVPPEPQNGTDAAKLYPQDDGESTEADTDTLAAYNELKALKEQEKDLKAAIAAREDILKTKIGSHAVMQLEGKPLFTWKSQSSNRFDSSAFKAAHPDLYKQFQKTSTSRVLRLK